MSLQRFVVCSLLGIGVSVSLAGCLREIREPEVRDSAAISRLASDLIAGEKRLPTKVNKVALVGYVALGNALAEAVMSAEGQGSYLDLSLQQVDKILQDQGFTVTPVERVLASKEYKDGGGDPMWGYSFAAKTRFHATDGWVYTGNEEQLNRLIDSLQVDGVLLAFFEPYTDQVKRCSLSLYTKGDNGKARLAWIGSLKNQIDLRTARSSSDDAAIQGSDKRAWAWYVTQCFKLLAAKMAQDVR